jgi:hypothetical protein
MSVQQRVLNVNINPENEPPGDDPAIAALALSPFPDSDITPSPPANASLNDIAYRAIAGHLRRIAREDANVCVRALSEGVTFQALAFVAITAAFDRERERPAGDADAIAITTGPDYPRLFWRYMSVLARTLDARSTPPPRRFAQSARPRGVA